MSRIHITALLILISAAGFGQRMSTYYDCPQKEIYLQFETPATTARHADIMQAYLDSSFFKAHPAPDGKVWVLLQVDTLGNPCCLGILEQPYCSMDFDTIKSIMNKMPVMEVATIDGKKIVSCVGIRLKFKLKHTELEQVGLNLLPIVPNYFVKGMIITTNNDTTICMVPLRNYYRKPFYIKRTPKGAPEKYPMDSIHYLANGFEAFENISYTDSTGTPFHRLMEIKEEGEINLYLESGADLIVSDTRSFVTEPYFDTRRAAVSVLRKDGVYYPIRAVGFLETIQPIIAEFPDLVEDVTDGKFDFKRLDQLVVLYNQMYETKHSGGK